MSALKMDNARFEVGETYIARTYHGSEKRFKVLKRNEETGYITFEEDDYKHSHISRIPLKGWADERVTITKGTYGRVCWTGGCTLYAKNIAED